MYLAHTSPLQKSAIHVISTHEICLREMKFWKFEEKNLNYFKNFWQKVKRNKQKKIGKREIKQKMRITIEMVPKTAFLYKKQKWNLILITWKKYFSAVMSSAPFRVKSKGADENIDHHQHNNIPVRFRENQSIFRGCTQALFKIKVNSRLFFKLIFEIMNMGTQMKDLASPIITVPSFWKSDKNWPRYGMSKIYVLIKYLD